MATAHLLAYSGSNSLLNLGVLIEFVFVQVVHGWHVRNYAENIHIAVCNPCAIGGIVRDLHLLSAVRKVI